MLRRSCCLSVKATEIASCLSTTCCSGRTPVLAPPNTSTWTTSVNQVSSAAHFLFVLTCLQLLFFFCHIPTLSADASTLMINLSHLFMDGLAWNTSQIPHPPFPNPDPSPFHPFSSPTHPTHSAEHKRHVVCEGGEMILRCKPPRVLNIYAAVYGRSLGQSDTCPTHLTRPPPFGESTGNPVLSHHGGNAFSLYGYACVHIMS